MKLVYVAGPYRATTEEGLYQNIHNARECAKRLWQSGYAVICPHCNTSHMGGVMSDQTFLDGTMEMLKRCDAIFMMPGWEKSSGSRAEYQYAKDNGIEEITL